MRFALAFSALLALTACASVSRVPPGMDNAACGASDLQRLVGQSRDSLNRAALPARTRIIGPETAVTMDYQPNRLNIAHDAAGRILRVTCG